ncbi:MAG: hypothetical protein M3Y30_15395 [Gemmatimonadota bacterium]|nr:hypothetical protein [Gemmatimonadota bacterium]
MTIVARTRSRLIACALATIAIAAACGSDSSAGPGGTNRSYFMGFSDFPPAPDTALLRRTVQMWNTRADAAIMHIDPPWAALLAGGDADSLVVADVLPLRLAYAQQLNKVVVIETDVTNGIDRTSESPALVTLGRSITEDTVQRLYRRWVRSLDSIADPDFLGLASETNLIRAAASPAVYAAVVKMTNDAAADVHTIQRSFLYVSVQAEVAWGRLAGPAGTFVGVDRDRADFPFIDMLGVSSYPYLGGFTDPSQMPDDYYSRLRGSPALLLMVTEGGWSSANVGAVRSSPTLQEAWIERAAILLDNAHALAWFQLDFTDINLVAFGLPADDPQLAPFVYIGLVDTALTPKPALAQWDKVFARTRVSDLPCAGGCLSSIHGLAGNYRSEHAQRP